MPYSVERAALLTAQLEKLATGTLHQLVGQFDSLDYWLLETEQALRCLDDYPARFARLREAQQRWVEAHQVRMPSPCPACGGICEYGTHPPRAPVRISAADLEAARNGLRAATWHLLRRLHRAGWIDDALLASSCERVGTSVDLAEVESRRQAGSATEPDEHRE